MKNKNRNYITLAVLSIYSEITFGQTTITPSPFVDFDAYEKLVSEVKEYRKTRLLSLEQFLETSKEKNVIILDTRSDSMYAAVHVKGAIHLNFSDFTQANLAKIIPSSDYNILIYCNNNFDNKLTDVTANNDMRVNDLSRFFVTKMAYPIKDMHVFDIPKSKKRSKQKPQIRVSTQFIEPTLNTKPITLALNIPTYINLYGYGYRNIYELSELVNTYNTKLEFEGTAVLKLKSN